MRVFASRQERLRASACVLVVFDFALYWVFTFLIGRSPVLGPHKSVAAFCVVCLYNMCAITYLGLRHWPAVPPTDGDGSRLFKRNHAAETLGVLQFSFQFFDLIMCFVVPGMNKPEMVVHHGVVAYLAWQVFDGGVMHEPSLFFLGACEMQSVPLIIIDFFTQVPPSTFRADPGAQYLAESIFENTKYLFALLFFYSRIYLWFYHAAAFMLNARNALGAAMIKKEVNPGMTAHEAARKESLAAGGRAMAAAMSKAARRGAERHSSTLAIFLASLALMTALQLWWGGVILYQVHEVFF